MTARDQPLLPYGRHVIDDDDIAAVTKALRSDWLTTGPAVKALEQAFAARVGARFAVACSSGTAGLHLAVLAANIGPGDSVVVPTLTFLATANAARYVGADVTFADVDGESGLLGASQLREALARSANVKAVMPVHLNGQCVDMAAISGLAREHGLVVIEDACHAIGAVHDIVGSDAHSGVAVGACRFSDMAVFSLHPVKSIAMGEGGIVTTNDEQLYDNLVRFRSHGMVRDPAKFEVTDQAFDSEGEANPWYYEMSEFGYNYRASDINCALGLSQLNKLDAFLDARRGLADLYDAALKPFEPALRPVPRLAGCNSSWHLYVVLIDFAALGLERAYVMKQLRDRGIASQVHYIPVHSQPYYRNLSGALDLPGAEAYYQRALTLPLFPSMTDSDVTRVCKALAEAIGG